MVLGAASEMFGEACPASAPFFGYMGAASALIFASKTLFFFFAQPDMLAASCK